MLLQIISNADSNMNENVIANQFIYSEMQREIP